MGCGSWSVWSSGGLGLGLGKPQGRVAPLALTMLITLSYFFIYSLSGCGHTALVSPGSGQVDNPPSRSQRQEQQPQQPQVHTQLQLHHPLNSTKAQPAAGEDRPVDTQEKKTPPLTQPAPSPPTITPTPAHWNISVANGFGSKRFPQAIIIGVKKGGTRALLEFLRIHPEVRALGAEPHFFDRNYQRGLDWYRSLMPRTLDGQITMEKTPSYFVTKEAPRRIFSMCREAKLIVVVRNPVTRAISDYTQTLSKNPTVPSFRTLTFKNVSTGLIDTSWSAVRIGIYSKHLENWLQYFPLSRILFVSGERLVSDPAGEMGRVQDFLGLKRVISDKHFYFNQTKGFPCLKKPEGSSRPRCLGKSKGRTHPKIDMEVVLRLKEFYRPFNLKFYQMTGQDFGWE